MLRLVEGRTLLDPWRNRSVLRPARPRVLEQLTTQSLAAPVLRPASRTLFRLASTRLQTRLPGVDQVRNILIDGNAFADVIAPKMAHVFGLPVTFGGLRQWYNRVLPDARWDLLGADQDDPDMVHYKLVAYDNTGCIVLEMGHLLRRSADGAYRMHLNDEYVKHDYRGLALTIQLELLNQQLLAALSTHPKTCVTLVAGWNFDPNRPENQREQRGIYVQAGRGYSFADAPGFDDSIYEALGRLPAEEGHSDRHVMLERFTHWLCARTQHKTLLHNRQAIGATELQQLLEQVQTLQTPRDIAQFRAWGIALHPAALPAHVQSTALGKAFLLGPDAPAWRGIRLVNGPAASDGLDALLQQANYELNLARGRWDHYCAMIHEGLRTRDAGQRAVTYRCIGARGNADWLPVLMRQPHESDAETRTALDDACACLAGLTDDRACAAGAGESAVA